MNLAESLDIIAQLMPGSTAARHDGRAWSYADLAGRAEATATAVKERSVPAGGRIALVQELGLEFLATLYGALACGMTVAPLNVRAKPAELRQLLDAVEPDLVVHDARYTDIVRSAARGARREPDSLLTTELSTAAPPADGVSCVEPAEQGVALLLFTSGTTGIPKRVAFTHDTLFGTLLESTSPPTGVQDGTTLVAVPNHHIAGITTVLASVFSGRAMELMPMFSPADWLLLVRESGADHAFVVPTMLRRILDEPSFSPTALGGLRMLAYGAAPMPPSVITEALERFPAATGFVGSYGQTETGGTVCVLSPEDHELARGLEPVAVSRLSSIGRPVAGADIQVLAETGARLPPGTVGELGVRRDGLPEEWHRTGDVGFVDDDGYVFLKRRLDDTIIRGGENIDPAEVEHVLVTHPDVADAAVVGAADEAWGQVVVAFVVPRAGREPDPDELVGHVKERLASFKAPSRFVFVDDIPRTATGKTRRQELVELTTAARAKEDS